MQDFLNSFAMTFNKDKDSDKDKGSEDQGDKEEKQQKKKKKQDEEDKDNKDKPPPKKSSKKGKGKGDPDDDGDNDDSSSPSSKEDDNDDKETSCEKRKRQPIERLDFDWEDYIKPDCLDTETDKRMLYFVMKTALTRNDLNNSAGAYGKFKFWSQRAVLVAPIFPKKYKIIFKELGMKNIPTTELASWFMAWLESREDPEWESDEIRLQVFNDFEQLRNSPKDKGIKTLQEEASEEEATYVTYQHRM